MLDREVFSNVVEALMQGVEIDEFEHQGYRLNPDKNHVKLIIEGLKAKNHFCPCRVQKIPENICPCEEFINIGKCCCKLWEAIESDNK